MNFARHEEKCRRFSAMASSSTSTTTSDMFRITEDDSFDFDLTPESDPELPNTENITDLGLLMSPTISLRSKHLLMLRHFFGVSTDILRTQSNQRSNKYLEMHRIVRGLPKVSSVIAVTSTNYVRNFQSSQIDPDVLRMISELCPTEGKLKTLSSILERSHILESSPNLKLSMLQLKNRSTHANFSCVKVWEDRFFYFRRLDDVLKNEVFGDVLVDSRLTWGHPGKRMETFESSIQLQYPGCTPVGLVFWSDSASPSNWSAVSFHPILVRLTNDPADKYTLVGLIPAAPQSAKKTYIASFKMAMVQRCWKILLATSPLKKEQSSLQLQRASTRKWISVRPWIYAFLGDLPELDSFSALIQNQTCCRTCSATGAEMNPVSDEVTIPRNIAAEDILCQEIKNQATMGHHLTTKHELIERLRSVNKHPIPTILNDSRFIGYPIPTIDDLYHNFDGGIMDNIRELIFAVVQDAIRDGGTTRVFDGDWQNFVSICLRIFSQKRFQYPGQHLMSQGYECSKKYGNFNARFSLAQELPFIVHAIINQRNNPGLLLIVSYVSFRNYLQNARSDCITMEASFERVRKIFLFLYCKLISPKLSVPFHPKIHRIGQHMTWHDILELGSFSRFGCKTGEAFLKPLKQTWNTIGGSSSEEFSRAITRRIDMQVNATIDRPLHLKPTDELDRPKKIGISNISIFRKTALTTGIRTEHRAYLDQLCVLDPPTKSGEKIRLNVSTCETQKPIHRDSFIEYSDDNGVISGGVLLEIVYQKIYRRWVCIVLQYRPVGIDELLFRLPFWEKTAQVILVNPHQIIRQIPMIPDFGSCFRSNAIGLHPSPIWLRTHCLLDSPGLSSLIQMSPQENLPVDPVITPILPSAAPASEVDEVTEMLKTMTLDPNYVRDKAPHQVSETISQLQTISDDSDTLPSQSISASVLKIQIRRQLLDLISTPETTPAASSMRSKRVRRSPISLNDYERS